MKKILLTLFVFATLFGANVAYAQNLINGGTFEDENITSIKNIYSDTTTSYSEIAHSGNYSLEVSQACYKPVTFKVDNLQKGKAYKFTAYAKLKEDSGATVGRLLVATNKTNSLGTSEGGGNGVNGIYGLVSGKIAEDEVYRHKVGFIYSSTPGTTFSQTDWTKFERIFYLSDEVASDTLTVYIGIKSTAEGKMFNYYLDDVSLEEIDGEIDIIDDGYSKVYAASGKDMLYTYKAETCFGFQDNIVWSVSGDTAGVSIDGGNLTVEESASGKVTITATTTCNYTNLTASCTKEIEIVPFTADNVTVNVNGIALDGFSVGKEDYVYEYRGDTIPTVTATGNQSLIINENTVFVNDTTKTYDIILKKLTDYNENLFYDGGFEEGVVNSSDIGNESNMGAVTIGITADQNNVRSGRYALKITPQAKYATVNMKANVKSGKLYRVTMWIKDSSTSGTNTFKNCFYKTYDDVGVEFYSENKKKFVEGYVTSDGNSSFTLNNGWNRIDRLIRVTDDAEDVRLQFGFCLTNSTSEFYVDDVSIYELDMSELGDAYMGAVYRTANGEMAKTITDADHIEVILYNPLQAQATTNLLFAEYEDGRLLNLTKEQFTATTDVVEIINKPLALQDGTNSMSILAWDTGFTPDIKGAHIK